MNEYKRQLWVGDEDHLPLEKNLIQPIKNNRHMLGIKGQGGLWTSTWLGEDQGSDWIQWATSERFGCPVDHKWNGYLLEPKDDLKILVIDTLKDMHNLFDTYGYEQFPDIPQMEQEALDFESMAKHYDGMQLTYNGQIVTRHGFSWFGAEYFQEELKDEWKQKRMRNLYGWDCESTLHFRWNFKEAIPIQLKIEGEHSYE
jgi:hypothetical protein